LLKLLLGKGCDFLEFVFSKKKKKLSKEREFYVLMSTANTFTE
jgi:hypothetical protein